MFVVNCNDYLSYRDRNVDKFLFTATWLLNRKSTDCKLVRSKYDLQKL